MDDLIIQLSREGLLYPQSPDEDLASRLVARSREFLAGAKHLGSEHPSERALLCYLALYDLGRALLSAKGYRPSKKDPHHTVFLLTRHFLGDPQTGTLALYDSLRDHWTAVVDDPDMPLVSLRPARLLKGTDDLYRRIQELFVAEFPAFRNLFRPRRKKPRTLSPERSFRD